MSLTDKVVVVTGGARGMGHAIVEGLLREEANVVALDRSWDSSEPFTELPGRLLTLTADVTNEDDLAAAYQKTLSTFGTVHAIVNNAGYRQRDVDPSAVTRVLDVPADQWMRMLTINALGPVLVTKHFIPPLLERRGGQVIVVSSSAGNVGRPGDQPYGASKAAATNFSQALAAELREFDIAVNIVQPPGARTTGYEEQTRLREQRLGRPRAALPWKPEAIVPIILFLAGQENSLITGRTFFVPDWNLEHGLGGAEVWASPDP